MHPLEGLRYLQTELADVVDHSDIEETRQVRTLTLQSCFGDISRNPFTLRAAKRGLTILEIFPLRKHFFENI